MGFNFANDNPPFPKRDLTFRNPAFRAGYQVWLLRKHSQKAKKAGSGWTLLSPAAPVIPSPGPAAGSYPSIAFRSSSGVVMGMMLKFFTSTSMTLGVRKAGSEGPRRMFLIPR